MIKYRMSATPYDNSSGSKVASPSVEFVRIGPALENPLGVFFELIEAEGVSNWFHPHALDRQTAAAIAHHTGEDRYFVLMEGEAVVGYGMLRGWDEGFEVPSLGIAIHPNARGRGLGKMMMRHLHEFAASRGAKRVRLSVYPDNEIAVRLFRETGYRFSASEGERIIGVKELP